MSCPSSSSSIGLKETGELGASTVTDCAAWYHSQGIRSAQFMKTAARASRVMSVMTALPSLKNMPPTAGSKAKPNGSECQFDDSSASCWSDVEGRGRSKSSVDDLSDFLASDRLSEKIELLLLLSGRDVSARVAALPESRCRMPAGGGLVWRDVRDPSSGTVSLFGEVIFIDLALSYANDGILTLEFSSENTYRRHR